MLAYMKLEPSKLTNRCVLKRECYHISDPLDTRSTNRGYIAFANNNFNSSYVICRAPIALLLNLAPKMGKLQQRRRTPVCQGFRCKRREWMGKKSQTYIRGFAAQLENCKFVSHLRKA